MSTARVTSLRGLTVIIAAVAGLVVTSALMLMPSPCCADDDGGVASPTTTAAVDGGHPGSVAPGRCSGLAPVVAAAVRHGAWTPVGVAAVAALLAGAAAPRRPGRGVDRRPVARYALCVMRT